MTQSTSSPHSPTKCASNKAEILKAVSVASAPLGSRQLLTTTGKGPTPCWGCTATAISPHQVVLIGGEDNDSQTLGSVHTYDARTQTWTVPINSEQDPRAWHTAVFVPRLKSIVVFGGQRLQMTGESNECVCETLVLDTEIMLWYPPRTHGKAPSKRCGHSSAVLGDEMLVFAGWRGRSWYNDLFSLDVARWQWRRLKPRGKAPTPRVYHSATVDPVHDQMVVFGGNDKEHCYNDVAVLSRVSIATPGAPPQWQWTHPIVVGAAPAPRCGHSATWVGCVESTMGAGCSGSGILICGGWDPQADDDEPRVFGDAFLLDTVSWTWSRVPAAAAAKVVGHSGDDISSADAPSDLLPLTGHSAVSTENGAMIFCGQRGEDRLAQVQFLKTAEER